MIIGAYVGTFATISAIKLADRISYYLEDKKICYTNRIIKCDKVISHRGKI